MGGSRTALNCFEFDFQCTYDMNYNDVNADQEIENGVYETETSSTGSLNFGLKFYTSDTFNYEGS